MNGVRFEGITIKISSIWDALSDERSFLCFLKAVTLGWLDSTFLDVPQAQRARLVAASSPS